MPSISAMTACSLGLRDSNSSATRGRPPVMSLVFVVSRGIRAMMSPASMRSPSRHRDVRADRQEVPGVVLAARDLHGLAVLVLERDARPQLGVLRLVMLLRDRPVTSSSCSCHRDAFDDVAELHDARDLGEDRHRERIPLRQELPRLDRVALAERTAWRRRSGRTARARGRSRPG